MESIDHNKMLVEAYVVGCLRVGNYKLDESEYTPIMKILDARINWVNKGLQSAILIDPYLFLYLSVASNENPGIAMPANGSVAVSNVVMPPFPSVLAISITRGVSCEL